MTLAPSARRPALSRQRGRLAAIAFATLVALCSTGCSRPDRPSAPPAPPVQAPPSEDAISKLNVGARLLEQLLPAEAARRFEEALALQPQWLPALVDLAIARMNILDQAMDEAAASAAQEALSLAPDDARAKYVLAYIRAERQRRFSDAAILLRDVVKEAPGDASAWYQLGRAAHELADEAAGAGGAVDSASSLRAEAEAAYREALELEPSFAEANYKLGRLLLDSSDAAKQAEGEAVLARHEDILKGRPAVQQNYYRRGALALAYPFVPQRPPVPAPSRVPLRAQPPLVVPAAERAREKPGIAVERFKAGLSIADLDGDGRLDVIAPSRHDDQPILLAWLQSQDGSFAAPRAMGSQGRVCSSAPIGDLDRDGDVDAIVTCNSGNIVMRNPGGGSLAPAPQSEMDWPSVAGMASALVDIDHDGDLDLHVVEPLADRPGADGSARGWRATQWIWRNDGGGSFIPVTGVIGLNVELDSHQVLWADIDGDNAVDLVASVTGRGLCLARNDRAEKFSITPIPAPARPAAMGPPAFLMAALDVDADADLDLLLATGNELTLLLNDSAPGAPKLTPSGRVALPPEHAPAALLTGDLDLDGHPELVLFGAGESAAGDAAGEPSLLAFDVDGRSIVVPIRPVAADGLDAQVAIAADIDGDGDVDLVSRQAGGAPVLLRNEMPAGPAWLSVLPAGREGRSNPHGLGAKLTLDAGTLRGHLERRSLGAPRCHSLAPETFGLGARATLDGIAVLWPSGIQQAELDAAPGSLRRIDELDRQPSSCPMLYGWNGTSFAFLTDCFDTAPLGLWVAPGVSIEGDPDEFLRLRPGWVTPIDGALNLSIAEFLNESLLADRIALLAIDEEAGRSIVVDEAVRLGQVSAELAAWSVAAPLPVPARLDDRDVSPALAAADREMVGWSTALPWTGLAEPHQLVLDVPAGARLLVLSGSLNFPNSSSLFGAAQAGVHPIPPRLEVLERGRWRELLADCGAPAGFHKDVVIELAALKGRAGRLRITTNLQASWDAAIAYADAREVADGSVREVRLLRAEKLRMGIPAEVQGPGNRWREFPRDRIDPRPKWRPQSGTLTPDGDVREAVTAADRDVAIVRPGEEVLVAFDDAALPLAPGFTRTHVLATRGWVKDRDPHTAGSESVDPVPGAPAAGTP